MPSVRLWLVVLAEHSTSHHSKARRSAAWRTTPTLVVVFFLSPIYYTKLQRTGGLLKRKTIGQEAFFLSSSSAGVLRMNRGNHISRPKDRGTVEVGSRGLVRGMGNGLELERMDASPYTSLVSPPFFACPREGLGVLYGGWPKRRGAVLSFFFVRCMHPGFC